MISVERENSKSSRFSLRVGEIPSHGLWIDLQ